MKYVFVLLAAFLTFSLTSTSNANQFDDAMRAYTAAGQRIIDMVNSDQVDVAAVEKEVIATVAAGVTLANAYSAKFPQGKAVLDKVITTAAKTDASGNVMGVGAMAGMSFAEIEGDWHDTEYFTKNDHGLDLQEEDNEHFTDPMHTIIHPVMVLVAAKDYSKDKNPEHLKAMKAEMQEGMEQVENTANTVK
ncbi:MAG: hypothetical protein HKN28_17450 [Alphaproteobacteria bacterium]|nr:hypothetical protein [Alphaproteobacteria bacterium]